MHQIRYIGDYGNSLFGTYPSKETAQIAMGIAVNRLVRHGFARLASTFRVV